jgi:hypothetical protein
MELARRRLTEGPPDFPDERIDLPEPKNETTMAYNYAVNDDVLFELQGPQGRDVPKRRSVYTITARLPIEADGRFRYRIKSKTEKVERVVTEEQISQLD